MLEETADDVPFLNERVTNVQDKAYSNSYSLSDMKQRIEDIEENLAHSAELITTEQRSKEKDRVLEIVRSRKETTIYVTPEEPTVVHLPKRILGGFKKSKSSLSLDRSDNNLIVFAKKGFSKHGEAIVCRIEGGAWIGIRIMPSNKANPRDVEVTIN